MNIFYNYPGHDKIIVFPLLPYSNRLSMGGSRRGRDCSTEYIPPELFASSIVFPFLSFTVYILFFKHLT